MGLLATIDEYREPIEYDLIGLGLRLRDVGTPGFTWRDLLVAIRQSPAESALYRAMNPSDHQWSLTNLLLAEVADGTAVGNWQRGSGKRKDYPKPIPRPGVKPDVTKYGSGPLPLGEMRAWLGWSTGAEN